MARCASRISSKRKTWTGLTSSRPTAASSAICCSGTPGFPLSDVPLKQIAEDAAAGRLDARPVRVFRFDEIREAHRVMEANEAHGTMVVVHD